MSMFRKLGQNLAPTFRKAQGTMSVFGRKVTNTANKIDDGLENIQKGVDRVDKFAPNPLTKAITKGITGAREVVTGAGLGGQAIRSAAAGEFTQAKNLGSSALDLAKKGATDIGAGVAAGGAAIALI